eukprot:scaffold63372_cov75-Phaeocystis_antarctica.AAC.3
MGRVWAGQGDEVDCADTPVTSAHMYRCMSEQLLLLEAVTAQRRHPAAKLEARPFCPATHSSTSKAVSAFSSAPARPRSQQRLGGVLSHAKKKKHQTVVSEQSEGDRTNAQTVRKAGEKGPVLVFAWYLPREAFP